MPEELDDAARAIIDSNLYMTIGTADRDGRHRAVASGQFLLDENDERVPVELRSG